VLRSKSDPSQTSNGILIEIAFQLKTSLRFSARVTTEKNCLSIVIVSIERSGDTDVCVPVTLRFAI
jgi:hypothetical protein